MSDEKLNSVGRALEKYNNKIDKDMPAKRFLSFKPILARILKGFIPEFANYSISEIIGCLVNPVEIATKAVFPDEADVRFVSANTEGNSNGNSRTTFDIRLYVTEPSSNDPVCVLINIEIQNELKLPYPLENRGVYYMCENIVDQHGVVWKDSNYQDMVKTYSVWICPHPDKKEANTIKEISLYQKKVYGDPILNNKGDLMTCYFVNLGDYGNAGANIFLGLLDVIFSKMTFNEKIDIVENKFDLKLTKDEKGEFEEMTLMDNGYYAEGFENGYDSGIIGAVKALRSYIPTSEIIKKISEVYKISEEQAKKYIDLAEKSE